MMDAIEVMMVRSSSLTGSLAKGQTISKANSPKKLLSRFTDLYENTMTTLSEKEIFNFL
jgi:hypothetical protein